jgi:hypothetical protein
MSPSKFRAVLCHRMLIPLGETTTGPLANLLKQVKQLLQIVPLAR